MLPFTESQFFDLFERYNEAIWPLQWAAYAIGGAVVGAALLLRRLGTPMALSGLALLWAWTGAVYHGAFFSSINPAAPVFAALFVAQALILTWAAARSPTQLYGGESVSAILGGCLIAYASVLYPLLNMLLGHGWARGPSFGVTPCPLVIFTFGVLLLSRARVRWMVFVFPVLWALIGGSAALLLNVLPDLALPIAAVLAVGVNLAKSPPAPGTDRQSGRRHSPAR